MINILKSMPESGGRYMRRVLFLVAIFLSVKIGYSIAMPLTGEPSKDARQLNFQLFEAAKKGRTNDVKLYLKHGASIKARDRFGNTAFLLAAFSGRATTVQVLLKAGSALNHQNINGSSALLRAVKAGKKKSIKLLLEAGANIKLYNNKRLSPLAAAAFNGDEDTFRLLLNHGAETEITDNSGKAAMVYAAARGFSRIVTTLLDSGIDANKTYGNNLTALMWAAGHSNDVPPMDAVKTIKLLIRRGARLDLKDNRGKTAQMIAADMGHHDVLKVLKQTN